ncbi:hypothetical protein BJ508DRAFT_327031 [Ascobolus immersus RN42]|uniref:Ig-like domain-containing protein n=1 Tax=Ascobolus immersus RN42 TaxID=1160509 RepID=A0A3N4I3K7_ASCIM|nr:hypothetical protein BJ508DRAFT_327031 [Ascobolus immersus RN42]
MTPLLLVLCFLLNSVCDLFQKDLQIPESLLLSPSSNDSLHLESLNLESLHLESPLGESNDEWPGGFITSQSDELDEGTGDDYLICIGSNPDLPQWGEQTTEDFYHALQEQEIDYKVQYRQQAPESGCIWIKTEPGATSIEQITALPGVESVEKGKPFCITPAAGLGAEDRLICRLMDGRWIPFTNRPLIPKGSTPFTLVNGRWTSKTL